jgi:transcriptional antiterminator RfaH
MSDLLLPLVRKHVHDRGDSVERVAPLFPCYLFARFDLDRRHSFVKYTRGVRDLVRSCGQAAEVPEGVISQLKQRCADGPIEIAPARLRTGDPVSIVEGPFRGLEAVFERYLSGVQRVAILLRFLENNAPRVIVRARALRYQAG